MWGPPVLAASFGGEPAFLPPCRFKPANLVVEHPGMSMITRSDKPARKPARRQDWRPHDLRHVQRRKCEVILASALSQELSSLHGVQDTGGNEDVMTLGGRKAELNVTPLIDVLLVLIIIFMVVVPQHSVGLPAVTPQPASFDPPIPNDLDVVVSVNKDGSIDINTQPIALENLQNRLRAIFATRANRVVFV